MILFLFLWIIFLILDILIGIMYYCPGMLQIIGFDMIKKLIHATPLSQNITFCIFYFGIFLLFFALIMKITAKKRRIAKRRKKLLRVFDEYGEKYSLEDSEIDF